MTDLDRMTVCAWDCLFKAWRDRDLQRLNLDGPGEETDRVLKVARFLRRE